MKKFPEDDTVQQATRDMETEENEVIRNNGFFHAFAVSARADADRFLEDSGLVMDED